MKFETAYKMAEIAGIENLDMVWFGKTDDFNGYDLRDKWSCLFNDVPFWVSLLDVHSVNFSEYGAELHIFLNEAETDKLWTKVTALA